MLRVYLKYERTTKRLVIFLGDDSDAILYLPKREWAAIGRPKYLSIEVEPEESP